MLGNNQFENFIIKRIVKSIAYDAASLSLKFNNVIVTERIMNDIRREALYYNLTEEEIIRSIDNAIERIAQTANKMVAYSDVNIEHLKLGQHFKLYMQDSSDKKEENIELLCMSFGSFLVLNSTDNALQKEDKLISVNNYWKISSCIDFTLFRNGIRYPDDVTVYRTTPFMAIEYYNPSPIFDIYDADSDFEFRKKNLFSNEQKKLKSFQMYTWYPKITIPSPAFIESQFSSDENMPFIVNFDPQKDIADFICNEAWLSSEYHQNHFLNYASGTYNYKNPIDENKAGKKIKVVKRGILKRTLNARTGQFIWTVQKRMLIK